MKSRNFIISIVLFLSLTSITLATTPIDVNPPTVDMQCSVVNENIYISYTNPLLKDLMITVSTMEGQLLKTEYTSDASGQITYTNSELVALGGSGGYQVILYANDKKRKVETVVVVITAE